MQFSLNDTPKVSTQIMKKVIQAVRELWKVRWDDLLILHQDQDYLKELYPKLPNFYNI
jgi:hypothetical protein